MQTLREGAVQGPTAICSRVEKPNPGFEEAWQDQIEQFELGVAVSLRPQEGHGSAKTRLRLQAAERSDPEDSVTDCRPGRSTADSSGGEVVLDAGSQSRLPSSPDGRRLLPSDRLRDALGFI